MSDAQVTRITFSQYLTDNGLGAGAFQMTGDYSGGVVTKFWAAPIPGVVWRIDSFSLVIQDLGLYRPDQYGAIPALANGIDLDIEFDPSGVATKLGVVSATSVKANVDWDLFASRFNVTLGQGNRTSVVARMDVGVENPIRLDGDKDHALVLTLNDDLTGLDDHRAVVSGFIEDVLL